MAPDFDRQLGQKLVSQGVLTPEQLENMLEQVRAGKDRGESVSLLDLLAARASPVSPPEKKVREEKPEELGTEILSKENEPPTRVAHAGSPRTESSGTRSAEARPGTAAAEGAATLPREDVQFLDRLGQGALGSVFRARKARDGKVYAVRVLPKANGQPAPDLAQLAREVRAASQLDHPHIARVHQLIQTDQGPAVVGDLIEGITLRDILRKRTRLKEAQAVEVAAQVAMALECAAGRGIVHKDIEPENIILTREGRVCLLDYGLSKPECNPRYMSLEQAQGRRILDIRSDIYSLGITLYEMLAGRPPFDGVSRQDIQEKHFREPPPDLTRLNPEVSAAAWRVIRKMLGKGRRDRYQTPEEVLDALEEVAALPADSAGESTPTPALPETPGPAESLPKEPAPAAASAPAHAPAPPGRRPASSGTPESGPDQPEAQETSGRARTWKAAASQQPAAAARAQPRAEENYDDLDVDELFGGGPEASEEEEGLRTLTPAELGRPSRIPGVDAKQEPVIARGNREDGVRVRFAEEESGENAGRKGAERDLSGAKQQKPEVETPERKTSPTPPKEAAPEAAKPPVEAQPAPASLHRRRLISILLPLLAVSVILVVAYAVKTAWRGTSDPGSDETGSASVSSTSGGKSDSGSALREDDARKLRELKSSMARQARKLKNLKAWYQKAEEFYRTHPHDFWETRKLFELVQGSLEGTELEADLGPKCQACLDEINRKEQESAENLIRRVREQADLLVEEGRYGDAIQLYLQVPEEDRSPTVETYILIETQKLESQGVRRWEETRAKVKELTRVDIAPMEEQEGDATPAPADTAEDGEKPQPGSGERTEQQSGLLADQRQAMVTFDLESAPSLEEVGQATRLVEPFENSGIHRVVIGARDYLGVLKSLRSQIDELQTLKDQVIDLKAREESKRLYAELLARAEKLLGQLKAGDVQKLCDEALADPRYGYHLSRIRVLAREAQAMADVLSLAKPHLAALKDRSLRVGSVQARVENVSGEELVMLRGDTRFRRTVTDLEPGVILELARQSSKNTDEGSLHRVLGVFAYYTGQGDAAAQEFKLALEGKADLKDHLDIMTKIEVAVRDARERQAVTEGYAKAQKLRERKQWGQLKAHLAQLRLAYHDSQHFKKIEEQVLDWMDLAFDSLEGETMVLVPAGSYKNAYDEPVPCKAFKIDLCEVSNRKYYQFLRWHKKTGSHEHCHPAERLYGKDGRLYESEEAMKTASVLPGEKDHTPADFDTTTPGWEEFPVVKLDWLDAFTYSAWARKRLPTANEFVRALSGDEYREFPWGRAWKPELCNANDGGASDGSLDGYRGLAPVRSFEKGRSPFGVFNLAGNVREFLQDMDSHMGGSYGDGKIMCSVRSASRLLRENGRIQRLPFVGFRCVQDVQ
ncbi:MAG: protein kinase [Planctomycetes bacterium]|nr:protein kinase [Planctomycetota bacterium]